MAGDTPRKLRGRQVLSETTNLQPLKRRKASDMSCAALPATPNAPIKAGSLKKQACTSKETGHPPTTALEPRLSNALVVLEQHPHTVSASKTPASPAWAAALAQTLLALTTHAPASVPSPRAICLLFEALESAIPSLRAAALQFLQARATCATPRLFLAPLSNWLVRLAAAKAVQSPHAIKPAPTAVARLLLSEIPSAAATTHATKASLEFAAHLTRCHPKVFDLSFFSQFLLPIIESLPDYDAASSVILASAKADPRVILCISRRILALLPALSSASHAALLHISATAMCAITPRCAGPQTTPLLSDFFLEHPEMADELTNQLIVIIQRTISSESHVVIDALINLCATPGVRALMARAPQLFIDSLFSLVYTRAVTFWRPEERCGLLMLLRHFLTLNEDVFYECLRRHNIHRFICNLSQ